MIRGEKLNSRRTKKYDRRATAMAQPRKLALTSLLVLGLIVGIMTVRPSQHVKAAEGVTITESAASTDVTEGGTTDTFDVVLTSPLAFGNYVVIDLQPDAQTDLGNGPGVATQLTFTD